MKKKLEKLAMDPGTAAALAVGANNLLLAHSHKIPGVKRVVKYTRDAAYHAGFQNGIKGEKGVGAAARNLWKVKDLYHSSVYEIGKEHGDRFREAHERVRNKLGESKKRKYSVSVDYDKAKDKAAEHIEHLKKEYGHHFRGSAAEDIHRTLSNAVGKAPNRLQHHLNRAARIATADLTPERRQRIKNYAKGGFVPDAKKAIVAARSGVNQIGGNIASRLGGEKARSIATSNISDLWKKKKSSR